MASEEKSPDGAEEGSEEVKAEGEKAEGGGEEKTEEPEETVTAIDTAADVGGGQQSNSGGQTTNSGDGTGKEGGESKEDEEAELDSSVKDFLRSSMEGESGEKTKSKSLELEVTKDDSAESFEGAFGQAKDGEEEEEEGEGDDEEGSEHIHGDDDFGQRALNAKKKQEDQLRERTGSWANEGEEDEDEDEEEEHDEEEGDDNASIKGAASSSAGGGGMMDLLGRSKAAKEELAAKEAKEAEAKKRRRRRKGPAKDDKKKKGDKATPKIRSKSVAAKAKSIVGPGPVVEEIDVWVEPEYNSDDFISEPLNTGETVHNSILLVYDSYGYDCARRDNLHMMDDNTLMFIAGNYLHFFSIPEEKVVKCRRAAEGHGLGHIALHPSRKYFAVGEKGSNPVIVVYTWPEAGVYRILRRGTIKGYSFLNFNPEGDVLCSQGMDPDYMLTIWDWAKEKVLLRCKAFANDVYRVTFSPTLAGDLTTCGVGHIRFWKMAETFTGLKLQGAIGRFGKTEISDILDYLELPNGKVLSGCEWGNILVWEGGLIVCEICGLNDETLHKGEITSLINIADANEVITVGKDGYLRIWDIDTIDIADTLVDDSGKYVVEPTHEIRISGDAQPQGCTKNIAAAKELNAWYCQDSWGRVWDVSIAQAVSNNEYSPRAIYYTPGGGPITCVASSVQHTIMILGTQGGHLWIIDYITKECLVRRHYKTAITKVFWLPARYDPRGVTFLVAFGDGCIRCYSIQPISAETREEENELDEHIFRRGLSCEIGLNQILRFSKGAITVMKFDEENEILYVCGEDRTLWGVYLFYDEDDDCAVMEPLAYYTTPFAVYHLDLHPTKQYRMILAGKSSRVAECRRPEWTECSTEKSFYQGKLRGRRWWFNSGKSERRKMERKEWRKVEKERRIKVLQEDWKIRQAKGLPVDEEIELARLNEEFRKAQFADDEEPIYKPEKSSRFTGIYYHINPNIGDENMAKSFFVHTMDYDAGYIYECKCIRPEIGGFHSVPPTPPFKKDEDDVAVTCWLTSEDDEYLLFGMADGSIRVMPKVDVQGRIAELMRIEQEEARKAKMKEKEGKEDEEDNEKTEFETDATTAPQIPPDQEKKKKKKSKHGNDKLPPFQPCIYPYDLENFFALPMHDTNRGAVREMVWSCDGTFLISVGEDGSIFSYRWNPENDLQNAKDKLPASSQPTEVLEYEFLPDGEDPNMLTVEETKQEEEKEKVRGLQEEFKEDVRTELRDLREVFRSIKQRNKEIPEQFRLTEEELKLPDEIYNELQMKLDEEVDEVFKIHEYESMQTIVQIEKIDNTFFKTLLYPHIVVKDISHKISTHTIRQKKLSEEFIEVRKKNDETMTEEQVRSTVDFDMQMTEVEEEEKPIIKASAKDIIGEYEHKLHTYNIETVHNIRRLERRLSERYLRETAWAELLKRKIKKDFIDPEDKARLDHAKANRGDFQLQASENYLGDHSTIAERRQKIIDMKLFIHGLLRDYNEKVVECRNEKIKILAECKALKEKIQLVQPFIPPDLRRKIPPIFEMEEEEMPEKKWDITQQDVEIEEEKELHQAGLLESRDYFMEEMFQIKRPEKPLVVEEEIKDFMAPSVRHTKSIDLEFENMTVHKYRKMVFDAKSEREKTRYEVMVWPKIIEQELLFKELLELMEYFHKRVKFLHDYKVRMDLDIHIKKIGMMTLIRELDIAKEFETQEKGILERLRVQKEEYHNARKNMDKVKKQMTRMNADVKKLEGELALLQKEVQTTISEKGKWQDYLWKVFRKKVKLETLVPQEPLAEGEILKRKSSSEESSDDSESTSQDTGSDLYKLPKMKLDINQCPDQLDPMVYKKIVDLRQKKALTELDIENAKKDVEKVAEDFVQLEDIYKKLEGRLTDTGQDIRVLQRRRQARMNELKCLVILRLDQLNCVDMEEVGEVKGGVFEKLVKTFPSENRILIFPCGQTGNLEERSQDLNVMTDDEKTRLKNGRHMHCRLIEELKKAEAQVEELKGYVKKDMVLKFGVEVDLDKVTAAIINLELLDKEISLDKLRRFHYWQRNQMHDSILDARDGWTAEIRENSNLKILKAMVLERRRDLEYFCWLAEKDEEKKEKKNEETFKKKSILSTKASRAASQTSMGKSIASSLNNKLDSEVILAPSQFYMGGSEVEGEIKMLKDKLRQYESRARQLRKAVCISKRKSGLPPVLPLDRQLEFQQSGQQRQQQHQ